MKNAVKTFNANLKGRDFVIGDLHGSYSAFQNLLEGLNFDPVVDRMFSVGDLVDRGPESLECLKLLYEPWFEAVLSNHEQMMLEKFRGGGMGYYWFNNGGGWGAEAYNDYMIKMQGNVSKRIFPDSSLELHDLIPIVDDLPFLITVNTKSGKKFHILHAELPSGKGIITDEILSDPDKVYALATVQRGDGDAFLWARYLFDSFYQNELNNREKILRTLRYNNMAKMFNDKLSHIISGHTILQRPMTIIGQTNIDTGAYKSYQEPRGIYSNGYVGTPPGWAGLTCIDLDKWKFYKATETTFTEVNPFVVTAEEFNHVLSTGHN